MAELISMLAGLLKTDERFITHRYYSSRLALVVGLMMMVSWFSYELIVNQRMRLDLVIIIGAMALTKIVAMLYYRITQ